jgi:peptidoglycan/LPS O-acetylase OafA/YrhL
VNRSDPQHIPVLDGLRGIAILLVLLCHGALLWGPVGHATSFDHFVLTTLRAGWIGVDLFFVLSGFLITGILLQQKGAPSYFRNFYIRRVLRIFPMYYAFLFVMLILIPSVRPFRSPELIAAQQDQIWLWTYSANLARLFGVHPKIDPFGQFWSLAVEERFWLIWPCIIWFFSLKRAAVLSGACVLGSFLLRCIVWFGLRDPHVTYDFTLCRLDGLAIGAFIAIVIREPGPAAYLIRFTKPIGVLSAGCLITLFFRYGSWWSDAPIPLFGYLLLAFVFGAILVMCTTSKSGWLTSTLESKLLRKFGKYSYSLYVIHYTLMPLVWPHVYFPKLETQRSIMPAVAVAIVLEIVVFFMLSTLTWHLWEKHFIRLKDKLAPTRIAVAASTRAAAD